MKFDYVLAPVLIGVSIVLVQPQIAVALSSSEVAKVAKAITVQIDYKNAPGSGVIIKKEGDTYTVLTARHVVENQAKYQIITPDGQSYPLNYSTVKKLPDVDLAVVQFTSSQNYPTAKIGNSDESTEGTTAYVAGFPKTTASISNTIYNFVSGQITANASKPLKDGYALVYNNNTLPGMSGGPVLNEKGELIGIHGRGDEADIETSKINSGVAYVKTGFNLAIPINTFLRLSATVGVDTGVTPPATPVATAPKADDFFIQAGDKYQKGDLKGALADYNQALKINPNLADAYNNRGVVRSELGDKQGALADYNQALKINPNYALAYNNRGNVRDELGDRQGALADYNQALKINPNYALAYNNRGNVRDELGDKQGALADYNQALKINPSLAQAYYNRGNVRDDLGDKQGALADYNQAIKINPNSADAYSNRGLARVQSGDKQGALADYNQALKINPNFAEAYNNRGNVRNELGDKQGALVDYNQALKINPNFAEAYNNRGNVRNELGDKQGALADYSQALKINPNYAQAYNNRGVVRDELGDKQGALADYSQALKINPNYANAYNNRGIVRYELGDKQGAIADLQKAANLSQEQGRTDLYQKALELIRQLQR